ncbi:MAG TPA: TIGR03087 family PEP-CTERM/XrtA system glycosyltransferase [Thiobacillaceae bacterium]|nr:TIGR03087 family PEP-CTERM/XrtA system glycosyltransferase [Thiobacillaceae bacterium]HNU64918.1 TIGR03087 family PEP-CTERM/XrtA system glycosyltransferase [Thiobacillaceae bacterium]
MEDLLFLAHRIPYPPDKGDKIRSWHMLRHLTGNWRVHLGAFVDDPADWAHVATLRALCADVCLRPLAPHAGRLRALSGLLTGEALSLPYYRDRAMTQWVDAKLASGIRTVVVYSSAMARFVMRAQGVRRIMDFVDIDSDKWRQYAPTKPWPLSWLYAREARKLLDWERQVTRRFDASLFVSAAEARDFRALLPDQAGKVGFFNNGVDDTYFSPAHGFDSPFPATSRALVFTGAMDYWPNVEAVTWFVQEVLPRIRTVFPDCRLHIVGSRPTPAVQALAGDGVTVTGRVPDVRPYLAHAAVVVAPLRIARGIQNKVLEGMAMAKAVVATPQALEGISAQPGTEVAVAETADAQAREVLQLLRSPDRARTMGTAARQRVEAGHTWAPNLARLDALLRQADGG